MEARGPVSRQRLIGAALIVAASVAHADPKSEAQRHVERGTELHAEHRYTDALGELAVAYTLDSRPELLYAIAQLYVQLDDCAHANAYYARFLTTHPTRTPRGATLEALATCKQRPAARAGELERAGRDRDALVAFVEAYTLDPRPELLHDIGRLHAKLGNCELAALYFERARVAAEPCTPPPPPPPPSPPPPRIVRTEMAPHRGWRVLDIALVATGVATEVAAIAMSRDDRTNTAAVGVALAGLVLAGAGGIRYAREHNVDRIAIVPQQSGGVVAWMRRF